MRVLFVPMAWYSHYFCMVPLAWAFRAAGHEVRIAAQPALAGAVERSGMIGVSVGHDYDFVTDSADLPIRIGARIQQELGREFQMEEVRNLPQEVRNEIYELRFEPNRKMTEAMVDDLVAYARAWRPDLVVADPFVYAATIAAEAAGAPLVRHLLGPDYLRHAGFFPGHGMPEGPRTRWPEGLLAIYERFGVTVRNDFAVRTIDPCPASMQVSGVPNPLPMRYVPYNGPGVCPSWIREPVDRPRVCVTWGKGATHLKGGAGFPVSAVASAVADLDVEVVVALLKRDGEDLDGLPSNVRIAEGYPLHVLLPGCDAIINQGGAGTTLTAASYGVPQVVLPQVLDQTFSAERLASTGAGLTITSRQDDPDALRSAVAAVLEQADVRRAADKLQEEITGRPSPAEVAGVLEGL
jgi:UDP:flavonoid glycosyltransferase YjiC (YdhE family)